jgi:hypothetical protein
VRFFALMFFVALVVGIVSLVIVCSGVLVILWVLACLRPELVLQRRLRPEYVVALSTLIFYLPALCACLWYWRRQSRRP